MLKEMNPEIVPVSSYSTLCYFADKRLLETNCLIGNLSHERSAD